MPDSLSANNHAFSIHQGGKGGSGATLLKKADASVEEQAKDMEKKVHEILEQSALLTHKEEHAMGAYIWAGIIEDLGGMDTRDCTLMEAECAADFLHKRGMPWVWLLRMHTRGPCWEGQRLFG